MVVFKFLPNGCSWYETHRLGGCQRRAHPRTECSFPTSPRRQVAHRLAVLVPYRSSQSAHVEPLLLAPLCERLANHFQQHNVSFQLFIINQRDHRPFNRGALVNAALATLPSLPRSHGEGAFDYVAIHDLDRFPASGNGTGCAAASSNYYAFPSTTPRVLHPSSFAGGVLVVRVALLQAVNGFSNSYWGWGEEDNDLFLRLRWCGLPPTHGERLEDCMEHRDCTACKRQKQQLDAATLRGHEQRLRERLPHPRPHMLRDGIRTLNFTLRRQPHKIACGQRPNHAATRRLSATVIDVDLSTAA